MKVQYNPATHVITLDDGYFEITLTWEDAKTLGVLLATMEKQEVKPLVYEVTKNGWSVTEMD